MRPTDVKKAEEPNVTFWRKIEKLVFRSGFEGEALSWKGEQFYFHQLSFTVNSSGHDLILLKLYPEDADLEDIFKPVKPLCMPKDNNEGNETENVKYKLSLVA